MRGSHGEADDPVVHEHAVPIRSISVSVPKSRGSPAGPAIATIRRETSDR
jgi:hypothetical protein